MKWTYIYYFNKYTKGKHFITYLKLLKQELKYGDL